MVPAETQKKLDELEKLLKTISDITNKLRDKSLDEAKKKPRRRSKKIVKKGLSFFFGLEGNINYTCLFTNDYIKMLDEIELTETDIKYIMLKRDRFNITTNYYRLIEKERYDIFDMFYNEFKSQLKDLTKRAKRIAKEEGIEI